MPFWKEPMSHDFSDGLFHLSALLSHGRSSVLCFRQSMGWTQKPENSTWSSCCSANIIHIMTSIWVCLPYRLGAFWSRWVGWWSRNEQLWRRRRLRGLGTWQSRWLYQLLLIFQPVKTYREHAMVLQCRHKKLLIGWFTEFLQRRAWDLSNLSNKLIMKKHGVGTLQRDLSQTASVTLLHHLGGNNFQLFLRNYYRENNPVEKTIQILVAFLFIFELQ